MLKQTQKLSSTQQSKSRLFIYFVINLLCYYKSTNLRQVCHRPLAYSSPRHRTELLELSRVVTSVSVAGSKTLIGRWVCTWICTCAGPTPPTPPPTPGPAPDPAIPEPGTAAGAGWAACWAWAWTLGRGGCWRAEGGTPAKLPTFTFAFAPIPILILIFTLLFIGGIIPIGPGPGPGPGPGLAAGA